jgi:hypothetical protein
MDYTGIGYNGSKFDTSGRARPMAIVQGFIIDRMMPYLRKHVDCGIDLDDGSVHVSTDADRTWLTICVINRKPYDPLLVSLPEDLVLRAYPHTLAIRSTFALKSETAWEDFDPQPSTGTEYTITDEKVYVPTATMVVPAKAIKIFKYLLLPEGQEPVPEPEPSPEDSVEQRLYDAEMRISEVEGRLDLLASWADQWEERTISVLTRKETNE